MRWPLLQKAAGAGAKAALCTLAACASPYPPQEQIGAARAMVSQAGMAAADAPLELAAAQTKLERAEQAMKRGDYGAARIYAEQAEVDARYAWTLGANARAQRAASEVGEGISTLRHELERRTQ
jgi:hypothetical protein